MTLLENFPAISQALVFDHEDMIALYMALHKDNNDSKAIENLLRLAVRLNYSATTILERSRTSIFADIINNAISKELIKSKTEQDQLLKETLMKKYAENHSGTITFKMINLLLFEYCKNQDERYTVLAHEHDQKSLLSESIDRFDHPMTNFLLSFYSQDNNQAVEEKNKLLLKKESKKIQGGTLSFNFAYTTLQKAIDLYIRAGGTIFEIHNIRADEQRIKPLLAKKAVTIIKILLAHYTIMPNSVSYAKVSSTDNNYHLSSITIDCSQFLNA